MVFLAMAVFIQVDIYKIFQQNCKAEGKLFPPNGALVFDEVKVVSSLMESQDYLALP